MPYYAYIALAGDHKIAIYDMDPDTGGLTGRRDLSLPGGPSPLAVDPAQRRMYVGLRASNKIATLAIDPATGGLLPLGRVPLASNPCHISVDRRGAYLFSAYFGGGFVAVHPISPDGIVHGPPVVWRSTVQHAHCVLPHASNRFFFVPHIVPENLIEQYLFDEDTGKITPNAVPQVRAEEGVGPRHYCYHPTLDRVYVDNEEGCSVTAYALDVAEGRLTPLQTISTLPQGFDGANTCAQIHISPHGRFLYVTNRGQDSIACYAIDHATGLLTRTGIQPTEAIPRVFNLDPNGHFLYAAGRDTQRLASYRVDQETGALEPMAVYSTGARQMWVEILKFDA